MHFQSDDWVKLALLTWDTIVRVRPRDLEDRDDDLVKQVRADTPYLIEMVPSMADLRVVTASFEDVLRTYRRDLVARYGMDRADSWTYDLRYQPPASNVYVADETLFWVFCGPSGARIGSDLKQLLLREGLAVRRLMGGLGSA
jgi:hypothetical protein